MPINENDQQPQQPIEEPESSAPLVSRRALLKGLAAVAASAAGAGIAKRIWDILNPTVLPGEEDPIQQLSATATAPAEKGENTQFEPSHGFSQEDFDIARQGTVLLDLESDGPYGQIAHTYVCVYCNCSDGFEYTSGYFTRA